MDTTRFLIGVVLSFVGVAAAVNGVIQGRRRSAAARWPSVPGKILASEVKVEMKQWSGAEGGTETQTTFTPRVRYAYDAGGQRRESERIFAAVGTVDVKEAPARALVARYPAGADVRVLVDPADPATAALEAGAQGTVGGLYVFAAVFMVLGVVVAGAAMGHDDAAPSAAEHGASE